ncbi:DnaD domain protein [Paenibacillus gansuensis]|uniref:DnaD domain protein n=1 Tax=Paenibacillus gansuensis TaxID=306542 RepID=A0ABW5P9D1_9BACL
MKMAVLEMRITNLHYFTENHRYYIYRDFALSPVDTRMLSLVYQPVVGAYAVSLYHLLYQQITTDKLGFSKAEQLRRLFLLLNVEPNEQGRKMLIEQTSKLEAMGLLQTKHKYVVETDEYLYEFELVRPLSPGDFFKVPHLMMLLRDKVGKFAVLALKEEFFSQEPEEFAGRTVNTEDLSLAFYDFEPFRLNASMIDSELEQALAELSPAREEAQKDDFMEQQRLEYSDIMFHFPRATSANTKFVENLKYDHGQMESLNFIFNKFKLTKADIRDLLDTDGVFTQDGELVMELLQKKGFEIYSQRKKMSEQTERSLRKMDSAADDVPVSADGIVPDEHFVAKEFYLPVPQIVRSQCDNPDQYNMFVRNLPYTSFLEKFFPGSVPKYIEDTFHILNQTYRMPDPVVNVLIHYISYTRKSWTRKYIDAIASSMLGNQIETFEQAVQHLRKPVDEQPNSGKKRQRAQKPSLKVVESNPDDQSWKDVDMEELMKLAERLDGQR